MLWFMVLQIASTLVELVQFRRTSSDEGEIHPLMTSSRSFETVQRYGTCYTPAPVPCTISTPPGAPAHQSCGTPQETGEPTDSPVARLVGSPHDTNQKWASRRTSA